MSICSESHLADIYCYLTTEKLVQENKNDNGNKAIEKSMKAKCFVFIILLSINRNMSFVPLETELIPKFDESSCFKL